MEEKTGFLIVDINNFAKVSDTYGAEPANELLQLVEQIIKNNIRDTDQFSQIGKDEFLVILKNCEKEIVYKKSDEISQQVAGIYLESLGMYKPGVVIGITYSDRYDDSEEMKAFFIEKTYDSMRHKKGALGVEANSFSTVISDARSLRRMNRALNDAVNVYTDIEIETMTYRQINMQNAECFTVDASGPYIPAFEHMCLDEIYKEDVENVRRFLSPHKIKEQAYDENGLKEVRVRYRLKNSEPMRLMESRAIFMRDESPRHVVVLATDVTDIVSLEQKNVALALEKDKAERERKMYQSILDESKVLITVIDAASYKIVYANRAALSVTHDLGMPYVGSICYENIAHGTEPCKTCILRRIKDIKEETKELHYGDRIYRMLYKKIMWDGKPSLMEYSQDITEERRLQSVEQELIIEKKSNEAKTDFLSNMSHEIRTPMNAIIGMTKLAFLEEGNSEETKRYLKQIDESSQYLLGVINDILDMSRIESGKSVLHTEWVSPRETMLSCIMMIASQMKEKNITFTYPESFHHPSTYEYRVDEQKTKQMLMNLLNNAYKFTPEGGHVRISVKNISLDTEKCIATDQTIVEDDGCGMSEDFLKKIFTPFEQERNSMNGAIQGTGLGLALSRNIARQMGGDISVESKLGQGSRFVITYTYEYRMISPETKREEQKLSQTDIGKLKGKHVLIAEDHPLNAEIVQKLLEKVGMVVTRVENGKEALEHFRMSKQGKYDLILMDVRMPVMDGLEATREIRSCNHTDALKIPIIAMTADAFNEDRKVTRDAGMNAHLAKPINPDLLYQTIGNYIN